MDSVLVVSRIDEVVRGLCLYSDTCWCGPAETVFDALLSLRNEITGLSWESEDYSRFLQEMTNRIHRQALGYDI